MKICGVCSLLRSKYLSPAMEPTLPSITINIFFFLLSQVDEDHSGVLEFPEFMLLLMKVSRNMKGNEKRKRRCLLLVAVLFLRKSF